MFVILEGPDCAGKTTLASKLSKSFGVSVRHTGPPSGNAYEQYLNVIVDTLASDEYKRTGIALFDRFHLGERVYGPLLRGKDTLRSDGQRRLERILLAHDTRLVFCNPGLTPVLNEWRRRIDTELVKEEAVMMRIYTQYHTIVDSSALDFLQYDYAFHSDAVLADILRLAPQYVNKGPGIGNFRPGVIVLVGDRVRGEFRGHEWPFVGLGHSSEWLAKELDSCGISERRLYWVNANKFVGGPNDLRFINDLTPSLVIALGMNASKVLHSYDIDHMSVPHPAFWKRFHNGATYPLAAILQSFR